MHWRSMEEMSLALSEGFEGRMHLLHLEGSRWVLDVFCVQRYFTKKWLVSSSFLMIPGGKAQAMGINLQNCTMLSPSVTVLHAGS